MTRNCCLVLIDLQNEFLSPGGRFPIHESSRQFLNRIPGLAAIFRSSGQPIIWVRAQYGSVGVAPHPEGEQRDTQNLSGTHIGQTPCCEKGSIGAEFTEDMAALISIPSESENIIITKTWYSAFKDTNLLAELRNRDIKDIFLAGLLTNICVSATALDALDLGFDVTVLKDCLGWRKLASHGRGLKTMLKQGARVASSVDIDASGRISIPATTLPRLYYANGSIPSWRVMMALYEKVFRRPPGYVEMIILCT
jgi:nicotinamidase-related amidase